MKVLKMLVTAGFLFSALNVTTEAKAQTQANVDNNITSATLKKAISSYSSATTEAAKVQFYDQIVAYVNHFLATQKATITNTSETDPNYALYIKLVNKYNDIVVANRSTDKTEMIKQANNFVSLLEK